jgi:phospholipid transport system substrate-binding protein
MKKSLLSLFIASALLAGAPIVAAAQASRPAAATAQGSASKLVLDNSTRVLSTLEERRAEFRKDRSALKRFIESEFTQVFDQNYAARLVLGVHGRGASDADVKLFAEALSDNLMSRYGNSLLDFNQKLRVRVKSETSLPGDRGVRVSTELLRAGGEPIPVDYLMRNVGGQWKIFDVMVEGISYVQTFRNQFDGPLRQKSIPQVAAELRSGKVKADAPAN